MPDMSARILGLLAVGLVTACGPSMEADHVKTPDELIADQEAAGDEQIKNQKNSDDYDTTSAGQTDEDKRRGFDTKQAIIEMQRAVHSAESCPESITEKAPKGMDNVTVTFGNDGHVKSATTSDPYTEETNIGKCVLRALKAIIVPAYEGKEETLEWELDLRGAKDKKSKQTGGPTLDASQTAGDEKKEKK